MNSTTRTGIYLALGTAVISGVSVYVSKFGLQVVKDPVIFTTLRNTTVGVLLLAYLLTAGRHFLFVTLSRRDWLGLATVAVIGGSVPFLLFFQGLAIASAPSAALIHKFLFLWVALLALPLLHEQLGKWTIAGLGVLALGQLASGWPQGWGWGMGENLVLIATLFWAGETILVKRLLPRVSTALATTFRMAGGAVVMWAYLLTIGKAGAVLTFTTTQWAWAILPSVLLLGYVVTWYAALKRAPATMVTSVLTVGAVITAGLTLGFEGKGTNALAWLGLGIMVVGVALMTGIRRYRSGDNIVESKGVRVASA